MMRQLFGKTFLLLVLLVSAALPAMAWDDVGHKITAYIAWQRMSPAARANVIKILRAAPEDSQLATFYLSFGAEPEETRKREYFMLVATWADIIRDRAFATRYRKFHKGTWHYADTFWKQVDGKAEMLTGFEEGGEAVIRLVEAEKTMRDPKSSDSEKAIAIAWIMHLGGDIHQPLHTSARVTDLEPKGDQGGNLFLLTPKGTKRDDQLNLHWYWDSITGRNIPLKGETCERDYIEPIAKAIMKKYPYAKEQARLNLGKYDEWQKESFAFNPTHVFPASLKRNEIPSEIYKKNAFKISEEQFALAGYRLGETLNNIFDKPVVSPSATANATAPCHIIRKIMYPVFKKQTPENIARAKPTITLLDVCPTGPASRPTIMVETGGEKTARTFDVVKVFASEDEARTYASVSKISDVNFDLQ